MKNAILMFSCAALMMAQPRRAPTAGSSSWTAYGGGPEQTHYSVLDQINTKNVSQLETAWTYETGDAF
jgi:quinoprotein glucose dehydrogenase